MLAVQQYSPSCQRCEPEQRAPHAFLSGATQADQADDLARMQPAVDRPDIANVYRREFQSCRTGALCGAAKNLRGLASDDQQDDLFGAGARGAALADDPAVAQHHDAVSDLEHLVKPV